MFFNIMWNSPNDHNCCFLSHIKAAQMAVETSVQRKKREREAAWREEYLNSKRAKLEG